MEEGMIWRAGMEGTLRTLVKRYVSLGLERNAVFLAERLYALEQTQENLLVLADCYMKAGENHRAYYVLEKDMDVSEEGALTTQLRYLFGRCCVELGKLREAEGILTRNTGMALQGPQKCIEDILNDCSSVPNGAAGLYLLGLICVKENRRDHAITYFALTLKCDPYMWDAYEQLCNLGVDIPPCAFFGAPLEDGFWELCRDGTLQVNPGAAAKFMDKVGGIEGKTDREDGGKEQDDNSDDESSDGENRPSMTNNSNKPSLTFTPCPVPVPVDSDPTDLGVESSLPAFRYVSALRLSTKDTGASRRTRRGSREDVSVQALPVGLAFASTPRFHWPPPAAGTMQVAEQILLEPVEQAMIHGVDQIPAKSVAACALALRDGVLSQSSESVSAPSGLRQASSFRRTTRRTGRDVGRDEGASLLSEEFPRRPPNPTTTAIKQADAENQHVSQNNTLQSTQADSLSKGDGDGSGRGEDENDQDSPANPARDVFTRKHSQGVCLQTVFGALQVLSMLENIGRGILHLSQYRCSEALEAFNKLPLEQQMTGWVAHQKGKACFEMADYRKAKQEFEKMREYSPDRTAGLEVYSTNLWHLKEEVELCYLAQQALELNKRSPEAWCAIGNCFSLQKEHDVAIKFFQRALQLDPSFTYAYTLSGHEYVSNEDFEKAVACYRHAIRTDARHYNAWYGLGTIYYRQEKYDLAEYHFRRAISINPRSSVLYCYLGMVLHASQKCEEALNVLQRASDLEPANPQAKYQRALVLRTMECFEAALEELEAVKNFAPRESSVYFLIGKISKQLGRKEDALLAFTTALDLDPKDSNMIKLAIDKLDNPNDMDETDGL